MRDTMRERLGAEITRKQFLQYMTGALLMVFGLNNLVSLLTGGKLDHHILVPKVPTSEDERDGFGSRKFGV